MKQSNMNEEQRAIFAAPFGNLLLHATEMELVRVEFADSLKQNPEKNIPVDIHSHPLLSETVRQLECWIKNPNHQFTLPFTLNGTAFQKKIWQLLSEIPFGETRTYQTLADISRSSPRAVGNACRTNPLAVIIPCHRVVAKNHMGGFAGKTIGKMIQIKKWLLEHEKIKCQQEL